MIYYVSATGNGQGLSPELPRNTLPNIVPGDSVLFNRGDIFRLSLPDISGTESLPITIGAYGTGPRPVFQLDAGTTSVSKVGFDIDDVNSSYIHFRDIRVTLINPYRNPIGLDPSGQGIKFGWYVGFIIAGHHIEVSNCEFDHLSLGVFTTDGSHHCKVLKCHFHGLDSLWRVSSAMGALGMNVHGDDHELAYNIFEDNWAECVVSGVRQSYSAPFEIYNANRCNIHHNQAYNHRKGFEMGKDAAHTCQDNILSRNLIVSFREGGRGPNIHGNDAFGPVGRTVVDHNTIFLTGIGSQAMITGGPGTISKNNIFVAQEKAAYYGGTFTEHHNLYQGRVQTSGSLTHSIIGDPKLDINFRPTALSPVINKGENGTSMGAFEKEEDIVAIIEDLRKSETELRTFAADLQTKSEQLLVQAEAIKANIAALELLDNKLDSLSTEIE